MTEPPNHSKRNRLTVLIISGQSNGIRMNELIATCSKPTPKGTILYCIVSPRASKTEIVGIQGTPPRLKIKLRAPPVDGAANEALIEFLSKILGVSKSHFEIISGHTAKQKTLLIRAKS